MEYLWKYNEQKLVILSVVDLKKISACRLTVSPQEIQEGAFVVIQSGDWNYYGIVTDIQLGATDPRFADEQSGSPLSSEYCQGSCMDRRYMPTWKYLPNLMLEIGPEPGTPITEDWQGMINAGLKDPPRILPVKNVPPHHAQVYLADEGDIAEIFGDPGEGAATSSSGTRASRTIPCASTWINSSSAHQVCSVQQAQASRS